METSQKHYFDDADEALSPETSRPNFVKLAPVFSMTPETSLHPLSDDGHDTLRGLEEWFSEHGGTAVATDYLEALLTGWAPKIPARAWGLDAPKLIAWHSKSEMNEVFLASEARTRLATALGELKITGSISPAGLAEGRKGLNALRPVPQIPRGTRHWPYRDEVPSALADIGNVLDSAPIG
ncbi:hypothetical protein CQ018_09905 [Arthrobacter sp. MYb227]|uniref:hypothetical protein n=1 Tax=Arthrobacter sp. MYb227 TaxID=1848601 RepID=UPI000CFC38D3|nr:hypothetical protein [Arthrobacter sp. MYb227]PQZ92790.1 hypothetical protein CQ018_09905 [Arthrobacter sp. MYb227]